SGTWYEVWQRPEQPRRVVEHFSLGDATDPGAVPSCADVGRLSDRARSVGGVLATTPRPGAPITVDLTQGAYPNRWNADLDAPGTLVPHGGGAVRLHADVPR